MEDELFKKRNFCCLCGNEFPKEGIGIKVPGDEKGTWQCIPCSDAKERKEVLMNKGPAYISWVQNWDKLPEQLKLYVPNKLQHYIRAGKSYHVMIWED